jgi:CRP-like cAMP-binding protein
METEELSEIFSLFNNLNSKTLDYINSLTETEEYGKNEVILGEEDWGSAVYFIVSGWVKIQSNYQEQQLTTEIIGKGGFFGEIAIIEQLLFPASVVSLSAVKLITISAQKFIQLLFCEPQIQHRLLKLTIRHLQSYQYFHLLAKHSPKVKIATVLMELADKYGIITEKGIEIYNISEQDLADLAQIQVEESSYILAKFQNKDLIEIDTKRQVLSLTNPKQINHILGKLTYE